MVGAATSKSLIKTEKSYKDIIIKNISFYFVKIKIDN